MTYNVAKVISDYLNPLCKNRYAINDTRSFADMIKRLPSSPDDEEYVSYDLVPLFKNIPLDESIKIYTHKSYHKSVVS